MIDTLSYDPGTSSDTRGWVTRWSYQPDWMVGHLSVLYTFKNGDIYKHDDFTVDRTTFYGVKYNAEVITEFNDAEQDKKLFKTIHLYSSDPWAVELNTDLSTGEVQPDSFLKKEGDWFAYIRRLDGDDITAEDAVQLSTKGIGRVSTYNSGTGIITFTTGVDVLSVTSGDKLYKLVGSSFTLVGDVFLVTETTIELQNIVSTLLPNDFVLVGKNKVAESFGLRGYYMSVKLTSDKDELTELFAVNSSVFKSYP